MRFNHREAYTCPNKALSTIGKPPNITSTPPSTILPLPNIMNPGIMKQPVTMPMWRTVITSMPCIIQRKRANIMPTIMASTQPRSTA